jgi:hypothetical protein
MWPARKYPCQTSNRRLEWGRCTGRWIYFPQGENFFSVFIISVQLILFFGLSCVLLEFFGDGDPPFDLSRLLAYRNGEFYPTVALKKVENEDLRVKM